MIRGLMIAVAAIGLGISAVGAQQDASTARRELMRSNGKAMYSDLNKMVKAETPYTQASVDAALAAIEDNLKKMGPLWAPGVSRAPAPGSNFRTAEKAWESPADFTARINATIKAVGDARPTIKDLESLKAGFTAINNSCNGCHEVFRQRNS